MYSTNTDGTTWSSPIPAVLASSFNQADSDGNFLCAKNTSIGICVIGNKPAIIFSVNTQNEAVPSTSLWYTRATTANGSTWSTTYCYVTFTGLFNDDILPSNIRMVAQPNTTTYNSGYPMVIWANLGNSIYLSQGSISMDSPTWSSSDTGNDGYVIDISPNLEATYAEFAAQVNYIRLSYIFKHTTDGFLKFVAFDGAVTTLTSAPITMYASMRSINRTIVGGGPSNPELQIVYQLTTTSDIYFVSGSLALDHDAPNIARYYPNDNPSLVQSSVDLTTNMYLINPLDASVSSDIVYITDNNVTLVNMLTDEQIASFPDIFDTLYNITSLTLLPNLTNDHTIIIYVGLSSQINILTPTNLPVQLGVQYRIRQGIPLYRSTTIISGTTTTIQLPSPTSSVNNAYVGSFIWVYNSLTNPIPSPWELFNDYRQIVAYNGATRTATVSEPFSYDISMGIPYLTWELLTFARDNYSPLVVDGTQVSTQQMVCYEIMLMSLILPNITLSTGQGNLIAFYPYVDVEFYNITAHDRFTMYSNNPHEGKCLFKVPIYNTVAPTTSPFVPLSVSMVQTVKFKPNDNFQFAVYLPNGELFQTLLTDTIPPFSPNPNLQVSATFSIKRLDSISIFKS